MANVKTYSYEGVQGAEDACKIKSAEGTIVTMSFQNWKLATTAFLPHELSAFHKEADERVIALPAATTNIGVARSC